MPEQLRIADYEDFIAEGGDEPVSDPMPSPEEQKLMIEEYLHARS